ncbi:MAG: sulfur carrier protein ThiS [Fibromonadales bacterium]|nr:sulfur carrier protein ThiS [Fibromonadales bacterium]
MKLSINGELSETNFSTLGEWAASEFENSANGIKGIAIAVNGCIVPNSKWPSFTLQNGDKILVVQAAQGG